MRIFKNFKSKWSKFRDNHFEYVEFFSKLWNYRFQHNIVLFNLIFFSNIKEKLKPQKSCLHLGEMNGRYYAGSFKMGGEEHGMESRWLRSSYLLLILWWQWTSASHCNHCLSTLLDDSRNFNDSCVQMGGLTCTYYFLHNKASFTLECSVFWWYIACYIII